MTNVTNIIWIERDVDSQSCKAYSQDLEKIKSSNMKLFKTIEEAIVYLKEIRFEETKVIIGGKFFEGFVKKFRENIKYINVAPKIIVLTPNREKFLEFNPEYNSNKFFSFGGIAIWFKEVKEFLEKDCSVSALQIISQNKN